MAGTSEARPRRMPFRRPTETQHEALGRIALEAGVPPPPVRPVDGECCERNCDPCVWYFYERALGRWAARHDVESQIEEALGDVPQSTAKS